MLIKNKNSRTEKLIPKENMLRSNENAEALKIHTLIKPEVMRLQTKRAAKIPKSHYKKNSEILEKLSSQSNRGAASVLVVFMMIIMVTFGALSLTAALANNRLGEKPSVWLEEYYDMDAAAEQILAALDSAIYEAEKNTWTALAPELDFSDREAFNAAFLERYPNELNNTIITLAQTLETEISYDSTNGSNVEFTVKGPENGMNRKYITIKIEIPEPFYTPVVNGEAVTRDIAERYVIKEWKEWQDPFEPEEGYSEIWDGTVGESDDMKFDEEPAQIFDEDEAGD